MQYRAPKPAQLVLFWLGVQVVWGALLAVSLQARSTELAGSNALTAYGTLAVSGAAVAAITQIFTGIFSDWRRRSGSRRIEFYIAGVLIAAPALFWFYLATTFAQLVASVIVLQIAMNVAIGPYQAVIPDFIPEERLGTASSWMAAFQSIGNACGAAIAGLVGNARVVAGVIAATLLATCALTVRHVRNLTLLETRPDPIRISRAFIDLFISRALAWVGFFTLEGYLYFYVQRTLGGDVKMTTSILLLVFTVAGAIGAALSAAPANRMDRRAVASAGGFIFIVSLVAFLAAHNFLAILVSSLVAGAAWGVFLTADWALGCQFLPRFALATAMGIWNLALIIPQILAPIIATAVLTAMHALQQNSAPRIAFTVAAFEVLAGIAWIWRLPASNAESVETVTSGNIP